MQRRVLRAVFRGVYRLSMLGLSRGPHVTRYHMYERLSEFSSVWPPESRALSISHSQRLARLLGFADAQITDVAYPEFDMLDLPFETSAFDAVVSDQVLEHVEGEPHKAIEECFRVLKPGGIALHTTCMINPIHGAPGDFWRFTPDGLGLLIGRHGTIVELDGWGNPYVWLFVGMGLRWEPIPNARWHPANLLATKNNAAWPISTWVLARKTTSELPGTDESGDARSLAS